MALTNPPPETASLTHHKQWLRSQVEAGAHCTECGQFCKVYERAVTDTSARSLIALFNAAGLEFAHFPTVLGRKQADETKMAYFGLIEEERTLRPDGGRAGWWRVTPFGLEWLRGRTTIPKYAHVYDGRCLGFSGKQVRIFDALKQPFDLQELMAR